MTANIPKRPLRIAPPPTATGSSVGAGPSSPWNIGASWVKGTDYAFLAYLLLIALEWTGLQNEIAPLKMIRFTTMLGYGLFGLIVVRVGVGKLTVLGNRQTRMLAGFVIWTIASVLWAYVQTYAFNEIRPLFEYLMFMIVTAYLFDRRERLDKLACVIACVAIFLVYRNLSKLGQSVRMGGFAAPYFLGDGNDFAWGMNVMTPIILTLMIGRRMLLTRLFAALALGMCFLGNIGTQSRGGTLGLIAIVLYGWMFVLRRKALGVGVVALLGIAVVLVAPSGYFSRMGSVANYEEDNSAQQRLQAWGAATRMALDHPLGVGAGNFNSAYGRKYNPSTVGEGESRVGWGNNRWISPHSIYFKVLAEYGFGGAFMLIWLILSNLIDNTRTRRIMRQAPDGAPFDERLPALLNMSVLGFALSGIFLGGFKYPHIFLLSGLTVAVGRVVRMERATTALPSASRSALTSARVAIATTVPGQAVSRVAAVRPPPASRTARLPMRRPS